MKSEWQRPEGGGRFAIWLIRTIGLYGGRGLARLILYPITLYFYVRRAPERRSMRAFLNRVQGHPGSAWQIMRQIHSFASTILDRVFLLTRGIDVFEFEAEGVDLLEAYLARQRGVLLIGSHFGSFEALRALSVQQRRNTKLRIVLDKQQTPALTRLLEELAPDISRAVIDISRGGTPAVLAMSETIQQGGMVGLLADRARPAEHTMRVPFLGDPAPFPVTPWHLAAVLDAPVMLCFGVYMGGRRYRLVFEPFSEGINLQRHSRDAQLRAVISRYAARLQYYAKTYPDNWFNFHDFWQTHNPPDESDPAAGLVVPGSQPDA
ncbi:MAG: acyltransferase [Rhodanobacteraceae bacterium]